MTRNPPFDEVFPKMIMEECKVKVNIVLANSKGTLTKGLHGVVTNSLHFLEAWLLIKHICKLNDYMIHYSLVLNIYG
jgi:hypothetical protein